MSGDRDEPAVPAAGASAGPTLPAWLRFTTLLVLVLAAGMLIWLFAANTSRTRSGDLGSVRELSIVASNFQGWPETAHQIARTNLFHKPEAVRGGGGVVGLFHPEIGRIAVEYGPAPAPVAKAEGADGPCVPSGTLRCVEIVDGRMTVRGVALPPTDPDDPYQARAIAQQQVMPAGTKPPILYTIRGIPLADVLTLPPMFEHVLIVEGAPTGEAKADQLPGLKVVAQIGRPELPVRSLNELPKLRDQTVSLASAAAAMLPKGGDSTAQISQLLSQEKEDALVPVESRILGKSYRLYLYPVSIAATGKPIDFYVVGVKPADPRLFDVDLAGAPALAFSFALAILLALVPVIKLAFLGPVDGIRRLELFGIIAGCVVAAAIMAASAVLAWDVMEGRATAAGQMQAQAEKLAKGIHTELKARVEGPMPVSAELLRPDPRFSMQRGAIILDASKRGREIPQPNTLFFLDGRGRQALDTPIIAMRDQPGADWDVSDRGYFRRSLVGQLDPGSDALVPRGLMGRCRSSRGFVVDQVRSRPDGVEKTVVATPLVPDTGRAYAEMAGREAVPEAACEAAVAQAESQARVLVTSFVMTSMLRPSLAGFSGYAVVDMGDPDLPVLFHSRPGRANVEVLKSGLDEEALGGLARLAKSPDAAACLAGPAPAISFRGSYNGTARQFAATRVPCTRWAVVSYADLDKVDTASSRAALHAAVIWLGLAFLGSVLVGLAVLFGPARGWRKWDWLWPSEARRELYGRLVNWGGLGGVVALLLALGGWGVLSLLLSAATAGAILWRLSRWEPLAADPLGDGTAHQFRALMLVLLLLLAVAPVVALAADARRHFEGVRAASAIAMERQAKLERRAAEEKILRVFQQQWRDRPLPVTDVPNTPAGKSDPGKGGISTSNSLTAEVRRLALGLPSTEPVAEVAATPVQLPPAPMGVAYLLLLGVLAGLLVVAVRTIGRALFGFGVALEAVEHPRFKMVANVTPPKVYLPSVRPCFMAIGAPSALRASLRAQATVVYDLFEVTQSDAEAAKVALPDASDPPKLLLFHDFELLLRQSETRTRALKMIERIVEAQRRQPERERCKIGLIADMSPLDRFLQSSEHREISDEAERQKRWNSGEDIRWSRILEQFTNYVYRAAPRPVADSDRLGDQPPGVRLVVEELAYLPDHVVQAIIPDMTAGLSTTEIIIWAKKKELDKRSEAAVVDYLASQLIEHYHYLWSVSSRAEQILIYRFAHGQLVNIAEAYALRSLVRRGMVVLDPVPRIVNRSFAQFVRHVEEPKRLQTWQASQPDGLWTRLRAPLTFVLPLVLVLLLVLVQGSGGLSSTLPFLLAAGPALLNLLGGLRRNLG